MKTTALVLMLIFGQGSPANLHDTIVWLCDFTNAHGSVDESTIRMSPVRGAKDCTVKIERRFLGSKGPNSIKRETVNLELAAFDLTVHVQIGRTGSPSFQVSFDRSDRADKIEHEMEMNNGSKVKTNQSNETINFDSEESANSLAKVLSHAIELCGGKASQP